MNRRTLLLGAVALGALGFGGAAFYISRQAPVIAEAGPGIDPAILIKAHSPMFGPETAKVTLVEFFDPSCEACRAFHPSVKQLLRDLPNDLRVVLRYTVFHEGSDEAVRILEAARRQDTFEPVLDALMERQPEWASHGAPNLQQAWQIAAEAGLDLQKGMADRQFPGNVAVLNADAADVAAAGVQQTPTFFLNGKPIAPQSPGDLVRIVKEAVDEQS
jgi:protein-disulfide isomerase